MSRQANLPGVAELFRRTGTSDEPAHAVPPAQAAPAPSRSASPAAPSSITALPSARPSPRRSGKRNSTGRERHDEKITVYVSSAELVALEAARLVLRAEHGLAVDRGRVVREAIAMALAELEEHGEGCELVRRLNGPPGGR
jgi:hypothetical protein